MSIRTLFAQRVGYRLGILLLAIIPSLGIPSSCATSGGRITNSPADTGWSSTPRGQEIAVPENTSTIPPHKVFDRTFTLNYSAVITVEWRIESGKSVDYYFVNREQNQRASEGAEPTRPDIDFMRHNRGIVESGSSAESLTPGEYHFIFRNLSDSPVKVWSRALGKRE